MSLAKHRMTKALAVMALIFLLTYLVGTFYEVTFDISQWKEGTREAIAATGGILGFCGFITMFLPKG